MKGLFLASVALMALAQDAMAADLPLPVYKAPPPVSVRVPVWSWAGFYAGVNGGYSFGGDPFTQAISGGATTFTSTLIAPKGGLLGGQVSYNWQVGSIVFGVEGDAQW